MDQEEHLKSPLRPLLLFVALAHLLSANSLLAATAKSKTGHKQQHQAKDRAEVYGGFSHTHSGSAGLNGFELSGGLPFRDRLQLVADLSHHSGSFGGADLGQTTFLLGIARHGQFHSIRPFARGLLGILHSSASTAGLSDSGSNFAFGGGGGATYPLSEPLGARAQVDLLFVHGNGTWELDPRFGIGLAYRF
jgi:hypothetical protein